MVIWVTNGLIVTHVTMGNFHWVGTYEYIGNYKMTNEIKDWKWKMKIILSLVWLCYTQQMYVEYENVSRNGFLIPYKKYLKIRKLVEMKHLLVKYYGWRLRRVDSNRANKFLGYDSS